MGRGQTPSDTELLELAAAARENASDLLADAHILADARSWPRAHALASLACEELAKKHLCFVTYILGGADPEDFWKTFLNHDRKLTLVTAFLRLMQSDGAGVREFGPRTKRASTENYQRRMRGLYVDYQNGTVQRPSQITEGMARELIATVERLLAASDAADPGGELEAALVTTTAISDALAREPHGSLEDWLSGALEEALEWGAKALRDVVARLPEPPR